MTVALTSDQTAAYAQEHQPYVYTIKIDISTDLLYCSGDDVVVLDAETYAPRGLGISAIHITDPRNARATVTIDDLDGVMAAAWYAENGFSDVTITIKEAIVKGGAWVVVRTIPWVCDTCDRGYDGSFILSLLGAGGLRPHDGLEVASRDDWVHAPEPGQQVRIGGTAARVG